MVLLPQGKRFLVGLSLDGPARMHDAFRRTRKAGHLCPRARSLKLLQAHGVELNVLCTVSGANAGHGREVYGFLREEGVEFIQFISLIPPDPQEPNTYLAPGPQWGRFLCEVFDEWAAQDMGRVLS